MKGPGSRTGVFMLLLGWLVFVFAIVPFIYGINPLRLISLGIALAGGVAMGLGGFWLWKARGTRQR